MYLDPSEGEYRQNDTFIVSVRINPEEECANAIQADLSFPQNSLEVQDISKGSSIISFWVKEPEFSNNNGFVSFAGGIPGGFCGLLLGDPGESNLLGRIIFKTKESGGDPTSARIEFLNTSQVLLNDGLGTPAKLTAEGAAFEIKEVRPPGEVVPLNEWREEIEKDKIPPESFEIAINQDPTIFNGEYFIAFQTSDKQTGIDYYEVKEGDGEWQKTQSPYLLLDQGLRSIIKVKAVDKVGNERVAEYRPTQKFSLWWLSSILIGIAVIWRLIRRLKIKNPRLKI